MDERYDALMRELGAFMASLQRPDGVFYVAYDPSAGQPVEGTSRYYPGEALARANGAVLAVVAVWMVVSGVESV